MLARPNDFSPVGIVRSEESRAVLLQTGIPADCVVVADVTDASAIASAISGCDAVIIGTSAKPSPTGATDEASGRPYYYHEQTRAAQWEPPFAATHIQREDYGAPQILCSVAPTAAGEASADAPVDAASATAAAAAAAAGCGSAPIRL